MGQPGIAIVWSAGRTRTVLPVEPGGELLVGRKLVASADDRISGKHATLAFDGTQFHVEDQGSTNGTYIAAERHGKARVPPGTVVRFGRTIGILVDDLDAVADPRPPWQRAIERAATAREHLTILGPRGSDRARAALAYATTAGRPHAVFDAHVDTRGLQLAPDIETLIVANPRLLDATQRDRLAALVDERPQLRVVMSTTTPLEALGLPQRGSVVELPRLVDDPFSIIDVIVDQVGGSGETVHERVVEQCLLREWPGEALELRAAIIDGRRTANDEASPRIMKSHLRKTAGQPAPPGCKPFVETYAETMGEPPTFAIPDDYLVMIRSEEHEQLIASLHAVEHGAILVQVDIMRIASAPLGWFQAGFWGHGVNSYAFYLAEVTDRHRTLLRLPYGGGAYSAPDEAARAVAQLARYGKFRALPPSRLARALVVDSFEHLYEIERADGRKLAVEELAPGRIDFDALGARVMMEAV